MAKIILQEDLQGIPEGGTFAVPEGAVISDLAREAAYKRGIVLQESSGGLIALGADHGGFAMKEEVKALLQELGHEVHDVGVFDESPVDYPDIAFQVALAVSQGRCRWGILVDGAGIGSCMAANKVPGVRAALCYDEATARNSRQHNYANVLTLGGRMISSQSMRTIVRTWLDTPYGEERHGRRVEKIMDIERKYLR
ncbi:MAG TPA: ribose 5-phosphate isomerase B [Acidobacteriota bacterium]|nr:ribose 5-phosphate isomerase B [Acidobacteriota bacterium]